MAARGLTEEQNERVRGLLRELLRKHDNNQTAVAKKLGASQPGISHFLASRSGTTFTMVERLAKVLGLSAYQVLGIPEPPSSRSAREQAALLCKVAGVAAAAIAEVEAEEITPETEHLHVLDWTDKMRRRDLEMLTAAMAQRDSLASASGPPSAILPSARAAPALGTGSAPGTPRALPQDTQTVPITRPRSPGGPRTKKEPQQSGGSSTGAGAKRKA